MDFLTPLFRRLGNNRLQKIEYFKQNPNEVQAYQLKKVIQRLAHTQYGKRYGITLQSGYSQFTQNVPVVHYEDIAPEIEKMLQGQRNILTPGLCRWFAQSSGTTNARSKYIPVPKIHLHNCHFKGGMDCVRLYLNNNPHSRFFSHKGFSITGTLNTSSPSHHPSIQIGDISAIMTKCMPFIGKIVRAPQEELLLLPDWSQKLEAVSNALVNTNIGNLSGVPSWMLLVIKRVLQKAQTQNIHQVWPNLEVFFHGGVDFSPYRSKYRQLLGNSVHFVETYNASEGFFGIQNDPSDPSMLLMLDYGVYYELIPLSQYHQGVLQPIPLAQAEVGKHYALVLSNLGGLYRYIIGDTIEFTSLQPYKIRITGRTKAFINGFGEELMVSNTDAAIEKVSKALGFHTTDYTAAPVFLTEEGKGFHQWVIEATPNTQTPLPNNTTVALAIDEALRQVNSDYDAKRSLNLNLQAPQVTFVPAGTFLKWHKAHGKLGGQHKVPRLSPNNDFVQQLLQLAQQ